MGALPEHLPNYVTAQTHLSEEAILTQAALELDNVESKETRDITFIGVPVELGTTNVQVTDGYQFAGIQNGIAYFLLVGYTEVEKGDKAVELAVNKLLKDRGIVEDEEDEENDSNIISLFAHTDDSPE